MVIQTGLTLDTNKFQWRPRLELHRNVNKGAHTLHLVIMWAWIFWVVNCTVKTRGKL